MHNVLIVDDEKNFLASLSEGLSLHAGEFNVLTAPHGNAALEVLRSVPVHFVVTDLNMPEMGGFELLARMSREYPHIPVLVMTAFGGPDAAERLRELSVGEYIEKPVDYKALAERIMAGLFSSDSAGHLHGITLAGFLQLVEMERKTCAVEVASDGKAGSLHFMKGELADAEAGKVGGEAAAYEILGWERVEIDIRPARNRKRTITAPLRHMLMEAARLMDERREGIPEDDAAEGEVVFDVLDEEEGIIKEEGTIKEEAVMSLESHLKALKEIKGYKAAGIMNFTGEMLAFDTSDPKIDLGLVGATFNDIFRSAHEASKKIGLDACKETVISTPKGIIVMRCSGSDAKAHFHLIGIMDNDGNQALMKMQIEKIVPAVLAEVA